jgi:hypothetical protein
MTVEETTTEAEVIEALGHVNETAKKCKQVVGNANYESPWDKAHAQINNLLDFLDELKGMDD